MDAVAKPWLPFEELVDAHFRWRRDGSEEDAYRTKLDRFEHECGEIIDSYWCESVPSAVALTIRRRRWPFRAGLMFHRVSDWATKNEPQVAELLHMCDELTIKISRILRGPTRAIAMRLVVSSATHVLALVDRPAEHKRGTDRERALAFEREQLLDAQRYYEEVGQRQAQLVYLRGMIGGTVLIGLLATGVWSISGRDFSNRVVLALVLGAAGALLSVMDRMSGRKGAFVLDYELGRAPLVVFGVFRPLLGAGFGLVLYGALETGLVNIALASGKGATTALYGLLSFAAGWSERLAKDVLDAAEQTVGATVRQRRQQDEESAPPTEPAETPAAAAAASGAGGTP